MDFIDACIGDNFLFRSNDEIYSDNPTSQTTETPDLSFEQSKSVAELVQLDKRAIENIILPLAVVKSK
mgnify:CR=1 FL=1